MPFNLLIFPLAGGYWFVVRYNYLRYRHQRIDRQKLLFNSVIAGICALATSFLLRSIGIEYFPTFLHWFSSMFPIDQPYFGTSVASFIGMVVLAEVLNLLTDRTEAIKTAIIRRGNLLENLFRECIEDNEMVLITLRNNKFYIGWVESIPVPSAETYVRMRPAYSGFRNSQLQLDFTTQYLDVYYDYIKKGHAENEKEIDIHLVLPYSEIMSAAKFNVEMYAKFRDGINLSDTGN